MKTVTIIASVLLIGLVAVQMNSAPSVAQNSTELRMPVLPDEPAPQTDAKIGTGTVTLQAASSPRYQISSYAGVVQGRGNVHHGCYVVDTTTGAVWHVAKGSKAEPVVDKLP
jgi:hypothetical protein